MLPNSTPSYVTLSNSLIVPSIVSIVSVTLPASSNLMLSLSTPSTNSLAEFVTIASIYLLLLLLFFALVFLAMRHVES